MQLLSLLSFVFSLSVGLYVGTRLLLVARRTRQLPELAFGLAGTALNLGGMLDAILPRLPDDRSAMLCSAASHAIYVFAASVTYWGTAYLYRPVERWSKWLARGGTAILFVAGLVVLIAGGYQNRALQLRDHWVMPIFWVAVWVRLGGYVWSATEAAICFVMERRGLKYGLSEPVTALQFACWAASNAGMVVIMSLAMLARALTGQGAASLPGGQLLFALVGLFATTASWFAFFPPRWLVRRATRAADVQGQP